jgi:hypothetical protein
MALKDMIYLNSIMKKRGHMEKFKYLVFGMSFVLSPHANATEGFYDVASFQFPASINRVEVLNSTVRIQSHLSLKLNSFSDSKSLQDWINQPPDLKDDGQAILNIGFLQTDAAKCSEPIFYNQVIQFEFCKAIKAGLSFPVVVPFEGGATGSFVSKDGYILTAHHVATWCIQKNNWGEGLNNKDPVPCKNLSIEVFDGFDSNGIPKYQTISDVELVANSSEIETWIGSGRMGLDAALLKVNFTPKNHFVIEESLPQKYDRLFMIGHPIRSERNKKRMALIGYRDADNSMRVSVGLFLGLNSQNTFLSDLDGGPGNSGSPVINNDGKWVGLLSTAIGNQDSNVLGYGLLNPQHVIATSICKRFEISEKFPSIEGCK